MIVAAAMAGLLQGATIQRAHGADNNAKAGKEAEGKKLPKVHDCAGKNECKALGGCKSGDNGCKAKNTCKGKGGCHITKDDIKNWDKITAKAQGKDKKK